MKLIHAAAAALYLIVTMLIVAPARAEEKAKPALTNGQALGMLAALRELDKGRVVKQGEPPVPWDFGSVTLQLRIAKNITALAALEAAINKTRDGIVREIIKTMPLDENGKPPGEIAQCYPGTGIAANPATGAPAVPCRKQPEWDAFLRQFGEILDHPAEVTLSRIKASEFKLEKNPLPFGILSAVEPIMDDDVSPPAAK